MAAYFITFRCYGTWLHGDARGSVHQQQNIFNTPLLEPHRGLERAESEQMKNEVIVLDSTMRGVVEKTIQEVASYRNRELFTCAVRTNHVHIVIGANAPPEKVMTDLKSWSTRRLRDAGLVPTTAKIWAQHGSTRYLWDSAAIVAACHYVAESQGGDIPSELPPNTEP